jgi:hypothetical protein
VCLRGGTGVEIRSRCAGVHFADRTRSGDQVHLKPLRDHPITSPSKPPPDAMDAENNLDDLFNFQEWASQRFSVTSSGIDASPLPESVAPSTTPNETLRASSQRHCPQQAKLTFMQEAEWDPEQTYDGEPPSYLRYSIEWKVTLKGKAVSKDTEPDVVLAPGCYWRLVLQARLEELLQSKFPGNRRVSPDDTNVVVSVTERSQRDLIKRFDQTKVHWAVVEKQLLAWGRYFQMGKKLRVNLSFNYVEASTQSASSFARRGDKRGSTSATRRMLAQRDLQLDAEQEISGQPAVWQKVYTLMRCPGPSCDRGPHCWIDPDGKKHYRMRAPHMRSLIEYVAKDGILQTHDDVPPEVRHQLYAEEQQWQDRKAKETATSPLSIPPINITNVLPGHSQQTSLPGGQHGRVTSVHPSNAASPQQLEITGFRDDALRAYTTWQQSKVRDPSLKNEFGKACNAALKAGFDLEQIHEKQNSDFFVQEGVIPGVAERFPRLKEEIARKAGTSNGTAGRLYWWDVL